MIAGERSRARGEGSSCPEHVGSVVIPCLSKLSSRLFSCCRTFLAVFLLPNVFLSKKRNVVVLFVGAVLGSGGAGRSQLV